MKVTPEHRRTKTNLIIGAGFVVLFILILRLITAAWQLSLLLILLIVGGTLNILTFQFKPRKDFKLNRANLLGLLSLEILALGFAILTLLPPVKFTGYLYLSVCLISLSLSQIGMALFYIRPRFKSVEKAQKNWVILLVCSLMLLIISIIMLLLPESDRLSLW